MSIRRQTAIMVELETISWVSSLRLMAIWFPWQMEHWCSGDTSALLLTLTWLIHSPEHVWMFHTDRRSWQEIDVCVCVLILAPFEYQNTHSTSEVRTFWLVWTISTICVSVKTASGVTAGFGSGLRFVEMVRIRVRGQVITKISHKDKSTRTCVCVYAAEECTDAFIV